MTTQIESTASPNQPNKNPEGRPHKENASIVAWFSMALALMALTIAAMCLHKLSQNPPTSQSASDPSLVPLSSNAGFWIIVVTSTLAASVIICWFLTAGRNQEYLIRVATQDITRTVTVILIVMAATDLALLGSLNKEISTLFAGIAGFTLGRSHSSDREPSKQEAKESAGQDTAKVV